MGVSLHTVLRRSKQKLEKRCLDELETDGLRCPSLQVNWGLSLFLSWSRKQDGLFSTGGSFKGKTVIHRGRFIICFIHEELAIKPRGGIQKVRFRYDLKRIPTQTDTFSRESKFSSFTCPFRAHANCNYTYMAYFDWSRLGMVLTHWFCQSTLISQTPPLKNKRNKFLHSNACELGLGYIVFGAGKWQMYI